MNPKGKGRVPGFPEEWLSHAKSDLRLAHLAAGDELVRREQVCFHAQQAAEKAIKAVLLSREIEFPLTHDIEQLLDIVESNDVTLPENIQEVGLLTPYAVESRYPGYWFEITEADVTEAIEAAERTVAWAEKELKSTEGADS